MLYERGKEPGTCENTYWRRESWNSVPQKETYTCQHPLLGRKKTLLKKKPNATRRQTVKLSNAQGFRIHWAQKLRVVGGSLVFSITAIKDCLKGVTR